MLAALFIRDIVLIKNLELQFKEGLTVLSGETGAGKSILLDALALALGGRGDGNLVRLGCQQGEVVATFNVAKEHAVFAIMRESDLPIESQIILRRVQTLEGSTKAYVNDSPVSVGLLAKIGAALVEIHGQHDERALIDPAGHRLLVDIFGELQNQVQATATAHSQWRQAKSELEKMKTTLAEISKDRQYLKESVAELAELGSAAGEEEELAQKRKIMMQSESLVGDISQTLSQLGESKSPGQHIGKIARQLESKSADILRPVLEHLYEAQNFLAKAEDELQKNLQMCEFNPHELENCEERLFALRAASRKYRVPVENLNSHYEKLKQELETLENSENNLAELETQVKEKYEILYNCADKLSKARKATSAKLQQSVMQQLPALKLENAEFFVRHECNKESISASGYDDMEFYVRTNKSTRAGAMMKVASGGELSRFLLALKVVLADCSCANVLVFDEIDTGASGAVADAIGIRLKHLSKKVQVFSITHAPQVAARASQHFLISKNVAETQVEILTEKARQEEIARMISGAKISDAARKAALQLLQESGAENGK